MDAQKLINIAIFGLSLRALNDLKEQILTITPHHFKINWTNIAEPKLDVLLINDLFFDTPSLQNLIKTYNHNALRIINRPDQYNRIENGVLYLPINDDAVLKEWFNQNVFHSSQNISSIEKNTVPVNTPFNAQEKFEVLKELMHPKNGKILIFDNAGQIGLADTRREWYWANPEHDQTRFDATLNFTFATMNDSLKYNDLFPQDLRFWMWNRLWHSQNYSAIAPEQGYFKLKYWPQSDDAQNRRDVLRMSACFAKGAEMSMISKHLELSSEQVRRFVAAGLGSGLIEVITAQQANFSIPTAAVQANENVGAVKRFFGNLRRRLGL